MTELERESLAKLAELETELGALKVEYADAVEARRLAEEELTALKRQKQDSARRQSVLENKIIELETLTGTLTKGSSSMLKIILYILNDLTKFLPFDITYFTLKFKQPIFEMDVLRVLLVIRIMLHALRLIRLRLRH